MKFGLMLFPLYLCPGLLGNLSAQSLSPSSNGSTAGGNPGPSSQNRNQDMAPGPHPDRYNVSPETNQSGIVMQQDELDLRIEKEWKEEETVEVVVQMCTGLKADAGKRMSAQWFQVNESFQVPLSEKKADRIRGRFRNGLFNFTLVRGTLHCVNESTFYNYTLSLNESKSDRRKHERAPLSWKYTYFTDYFSPYGDLKTDNFGFQYPPSAYCISSLTAEAIEVEICDPREPNSAQGPSTGQKTWETEASVVITKCCSPGLVVRVDYNTTSGKQHGSCAEALEDEWTPYFFRRFGTLFSGLGYSASDIDSGVAGKKRPYYRHEYSDCDPTEEFFPDEGNRRARALKVAQIRVLESGEILIRPTGQHPWERPKETPTSRGYIDPTNMCIDGLLNVDVNDVTPAELIYKRTPNHQVIVFCPQPEEYNVVSTSSVVEFSISCVTSFFLAITVVVYALIWKSQNIHGRTSAAFSLFAFLFDLSSALSSGASVFAYQEIILFQSYTCVAIAVVNLFSYIGMFSWMAILNFDLWVTLRSMTPATSRSKGRKRFLSYCAFGLGAPLIVVSVALGFEHGFGLFDEGVIRPLFGRFGCVVHSTAFVYYHSVPALLLYLVNVAFATLTIVSLYTWRKDTRRIKQSNSKASRSQGMLVWKLFLLMGFSWTFDLLSWFVVGIELSWYWLIFDAYNVLQALGLFWIFVWKKEVKDELCSSYPLFKSAFDWIERTLKRGLSLSASAGPVPSSSHSTGAPPPPTTSALTTTLPPTDSNPSESLSV